MKKLVKRLIAAALPDAALQRLKRIHYARMLRAITEDDERDITVVRQLVKPGDVAADVGANFGVYTRFLSQLVGPGGTVFSVEPIPQTFDILSSNVSRLGLGNVRLINGAASDADETVTMEVPLYDDGGENFYEARIVTETTNSSLRRVTVHTHRLDSLLADAPGEVAFIKLDVEGHELSALHGAAALIEASRPAWLIEIMGDPDDATSDAAAAFATMAEHGYQAWWYDGTELRERTPGERNDNYFFLAANHLDALRQKGFPLHRR